MRGVARAGVAVAACALGAVGGCRAPLAQPPTHVVRQEGSNREAASERGMALRIRETAREYREQAPVPRVAFFDLTYPAGADEYAAMAGYGVALVTAVCQDADELPLARIFVRREAGDLELEPLRVRRSEIPPSEVEIVQTLGRHRADALYLIPLTAVREPGRLLLDFARNRADFVLAEFPLAELDPGYAIGPPSGAPPSPDALGALIEREIPLFAVPLEDPARR